jgi:hypothetical protein
MKSKRNYLFSGLIKCHYCNKNMRGISDRSIKKYICSNKECIRNPIREDDILDLLSQYFSYHNITLILTNEYLSNRIKSVYVNNGLFIIEFYNTPKLIYTQNNISFIG